MTPNRRKILKIAAATTASMILPLHSTFGILHAQNRDRVRLAVIGTGSRGKGLLNILKDLDFIEIVAICDTLAFRLKDRFFRAVLFC